LALVGPSSNLCRCFQGMAITRANARRVEEGDEEQEVPIQVPYQASPQVPNEAGTISNVEIRAALQLLTQAMMAQVIGK